MRYEEHIHARVWALFEAYKADGAIMFHVANGERRGARTAAKLKRMGVVPGVPDFVCIARDRVFFLELKRPQGRMSNAQFDFVRAAALQHVPTFTAWSVEGAVEVLQKHGVLSADIEFTSGEPRRFDGAPGAPGVEIPGAPIPEFTKEAAAVG